jgi:hypothetical protein
MPILFQIDEIEPPVQVELKKKRGRPKKGGATDTQRGQAARYRTHVREAVDIPKYECLFRNLSYIVHSADEYQKDDNPFATGADNDEYDAEAQKILDQAEANLKRLRELKDAGVKPSQEGLCRADWDREKSSLKPWKIEKQKALYQAHEKALMAAEDKKKKIAKAKADEVGELAMRGKAKGPSAEAVEANRQKQLAENAAKREAKKAAKEAEKAEKAAPPAFDFAAIDAMRRPKTSGRGAPIQLWGGKLSTKYINEFVANSYNAKGKLPAKIGDFQLDKSLSGQRAQVYHNPATGEAVVVHRGSQGIHDWGNNLKYFLGFDLKNTDRGKFAAKVQKEAEAKYGAKNISTLGHSIGGKIASDVGGDSKEIITLNRAVAGRDLFKNPIKENEYSIRSQLDPVSLLLPKDSKTLTIPSTSLNPLTEHSTEVVKRLDPAVEVGRGFNRAALAKLNKKQLKEIIKALPKIKDGFKLVGKGKPQLVDYCCERCGVGLCKCVGDCLCRV